MLRTYLKTLSSVVAAALIGPAATCHAQKDASLSSTPFLELSSDLSQGVITRGFHVNRDVKAAVRAEGMGFGGKMYAYPWILNAETRDLVWEMTYANSKDTGGRNRLYEGVVRLPPGDYLIFYSSVLWLKGGALRLGPLEDWLKSARQEQRNWGLSLSLNTPEVDPDAIGTFPGREASEPLLRLDHLGDDVSVRTDLHVTSDARLRVYAVGEGPSFMRRIVDGSWLVESRTRKRVWEMTMENTVEAGGAEKNRLFRGEIALPPGDYELYTITDDSHSADGWNERPPRDPQGWGIKMTLIQGSVEVREPAPRLVMVAMTGIGDAELRKTAFQLDAAAPVQVYAVGEVNFAAGEMVDYGRIVNADTGERVWKMTLDNTVYGGGSVRNRLFDGIVQLTAGRYIVNFRTDETHSFQGWRETSPFDRAKYGITVSALDESTRWRQIPALDSPAEKHILAQIAQVGNNRDLTAKFKLAAKERVRIHALGEGIPPTMMADYAWIETPEGKVVWKMQYEASGHAGGSSKNRLFDGEIELEAGPYLLRYKTDDSHAFGTWNAREPDDAAAYGVTLYKADAQTRP